MPETENTLPQPQEERVPTASLQERIEALTAELGKNLKRERLPRTLAMGASKNIAGARIVDLIELLNSATADFEENTAGLKRAAETMDCTPEKLFDNQSLPNAWKTKKWRRETEDLIAELKSILNLYCEHLERTAEKKDRDSAEKEASNLAGIPEIPEIPENEEIIIAVIKTDFLEKHTAEKKDPAEKAIAYVIWEDYFDEVLKIAKRKFPNKKYATARIEFIKDITLPLNPFENKSINIPALITEMFSKTKVISDLCFDLAENTEKFWGAIRILQEIRTGDSDLFTVQELKSMEYPGNKSDAPHKKQRWQQERGKKMGEQIQLAKSEVDFLNRISAVLEFLAETHKEKIAQMDLFETPEEPRVYADYLPFHAEIEQTPSSLCKAEEFKQKLSDIYNGNFVNGARIPMTVKDWREIALTCRAATLKAIADMWRMRQTALERLEDLNRERRRRCELEAANATLRERLEHAIGEKL